MLNRKSKSYTALFSSPEEYKSYEFAGVPDVQRPALLKRRREFLRTLSAPEADVHQYQLLVLTLELSDKYILPLPTLPWSQMSTAVVHLHNGRRYLCTVDNGIYLTDVEGYPQGIPFGIQDISHFEPSLYWVSLSTMSTRSEILHAAGLLDKMVHGPLSPGNY